ncbi:calcium/calmodulin-regulated receptor-like kinase 2 [Camellia sinensis]|uniref:calcium/calmodulin-regulated receptor-like kinase 2 n=1 Tax=Camellia sinensis TaxID=4442 RepID=UPI0010359F1D|nr:calcium/calmodulin-regulated receptor-like kinase 2 [Camellia sinensis]XP_028073951.1 calcium/calmodulin-regulated receptor-like kinase 2 [Camellia sinensis]
MVPKGDLVIIGISVGLALGLFIAALVFFGIRWYKKRAHLRQCANDRSATTLPLIRTNGLGTSIDYSASISNSIADKGSDFLAKNSQPSWWSHRSKDRFASASGIPRYSFKDVQKATQNFTTILGEGSFGPVCKATMATGEVVAVKVLASDSKQGEKEFQTEVSLLGRLHHRNLVNLVGYCVDKGQHMLIYEFMSNGSLANLLYSQEELVLSWEERLQIALDISHGIEYLHDGAVPPVIHRDLKSANILLDRSMRAKVADFGLSKEEAFDGHKSGIKGTYGYIDPAYISTNKFTMKSDIYSFGIILFELITAIHPHQNLMEYVNLAAMSPDGVDEILDERLVGEYNIVEVRGLASIAHKCLHKTPRRRPSIGEVSQAILKIKQRQLAKEDTMSFAGEDLSRMISRIELQQVELSKMASIKITA